MPRPVDDPLIRQHIEQMSRRNGGASAAALLSELHLRSMKSTWLDETLFLHVGQMGSIKHYPVTPTIIESLIDASKAASGLIDDAIKSIKQHSEELRRRDDLQLLDYIALVNVANLEDLQTIQEVLSNQLSQEAA